MPSYDRYMLGVTLFLMLAMSSADIHCKMKSGCSTQCDPVGWNNIEEHLFNKEFSITCRNNEDDKLREEFEDLKTENRIVKNILLTVQENHNKEIEELKTENQKSKEEYQNLKNLIPVIQEKHSNEFEDLKTENRIVKNLLLTVQENHNKEIEELKTENQKSKEEYQNLKNLIPVIQEKHSNDITNMNMTIFDLKKELDIITTTGCHEVNPENIKEKSGTGGVFDIYSLNSQIEVVCDLTTDGGKWTVFQRRFDGSQGFNQDWKKYVEGFGSLTGEFWLGLKKIHLLTQTGQYELRIEMTDGSGKVVIAKYQTFSISGSSDNYRLNIGEFSGTGVSDMLTQHNNMDFSTKDRDNDKSSENNCATWQGGGGGWWYNRCYQVMLNRPYSKIVWWGFGFNIRKTEMKFRKK